MNDRAPLYWTDTPADATQDLGWLPLSDAQRVVWLDLRLGASPHAYELGGRIRIDGPLDLDVMRQAMRTLSAQHDALRLRVDETQPRQRLVPVGSMDIEVHALPAGLSDDAADSAANDIVSQALGEPMLLGERPLVRMVLVCISPLRHQLLWRFHHLVADSSAVALFFQSWARTYDILASAVARELPPGSSFVDTLVADQAYAQSTQAELDLAHWRRRFATLPAPLLSAREASAAEVTPEPLRWHLEGAAYAHWCAACTAAGVTEQRALVALLALTLGTRFDRRDLTLGLALHRRDRQTMNVIGMLSAAMPARCQWQADDTLRHAVRRMAEQLDQDYRHQRAPMDAIGRALALAGREQGPLFQASISYTVDAITGQGQLKGASGLTLKQQDLAPHAIVPLPLLVTNQPSSQRLSFMLAADPSYIDAAAARSIRDALHRTIIQFSQQPNALVAELEPAGPDELAMLHCFNPAPSAFAEAVTLHALVRRQARETPNAVALIDGERALSYAALDAASDALAQRLHQALAANPAPEPVVAVALPRSARTVLWLLAILKAGAVYLPLDTSYPAQRLQFMMEDAGAALLLADPDEAATSCLQAAALLDGTTVADAAVGAVTLADAASGDPAAGLPDDTGVAAAQRLAYIIYTSGSTGLPKPVGMAHRALVNLDHARQAHDPVGPGCRVLAAISVGFDVSIGQLLLPLLRGAAIVIAPPLRSLEADAFWALLARHQVTHINSVPSFFDTVSEALVSQAEDQRYRGLQRVMLGGEVLTGALARKLQQRLPGTQIVNMYGPTETCIDATACVVPDAPVALPAALPIGRPLPNYRVHIVDGLGRLVPVGVTGELCIAGAGLARGYLGRPGATAEKFTADSWAPADGTATHPTAGPSAGQRLYRTGDLARWMADGQIEFLGRIDQQVKIRGHRIETGEIEAVLLLHPAVAQAAVTARLDERGQGQLVGYLVERPGTRLPAFDELKRWLLTHLPEPMVPALLMPLPLLPLTPNGKLDRRALPVPVAGDLAQPAHVAPVGEAECALAALWAELLKRERIGRDDNFFNLGGHSLLAISLADRLRQAGWVLDVKSLFANPTLRDMALACRPLLDSPDADTEAVPPRAVPAGAARITPHMLPMLDWTQAQIDAAVAQVPGGAAAVQDIYPLTPLQRGMVFHHMSQAAGDVFLRPMVLGFAQRSALDAFFWALQQITARHDVLRTSVVWQGVPEPVQIVWCDAALMLEELPAAHDDEAAGDALARLRSHVNGPACQLDLRRAPLLRAVALHDPVRQRWLLALVMHHLVIDQVSASLVLQEVLQLQRQQTLPEPVPFRNLIWHARQGDVAADHEAYFRGMLADVDAPTAPFDLHELLRPQQGVAEATLPLPQALADELRLQAQQAGVGAPALFHLAWGLVLAQASGGTAPDVVFGTVLLGRMNVGPGAERAVGMLINTLPLRLRVGALSVDQALLQAQQRLGELMLHDQAQLAQAQRCSGVAAPTPLFTALLNVRQTPTPDTLAALPEVLWAKGDTGYPLALAVDDNGRDFSLTVQAVAPLEPLRVARLMVHAIGQLVTALRSAPQTPCTALNLIGDHERAQQLQRFNPAGRSYPQHATLHEAVQAQVRATPQALAVADGPLRLSYAELDARSDALARRIRAAVAGAGAEPVVGVALPRSAETVVALLAILKAGGVYLPLDTAYPQTRLQYMLDDAQAALLIDRPGDALTAGLEAARLDNNMAEAALPAEADPLRAQRLAYVIYTSGSTGQPKPVGMGHGAAVNLAHARQDHDPLGPGDRVLAAISVGFDVSIGQLLLPLLSGATIVIAPPLRTLQAQEFWALLRDQGVTHINSVPSFFETVSEALPSEGFSGLKRLMLGGEALTGALARKLQQRLPGTQIVNMYGPTEACIDATAYVVPAEGELPAALPIGRPLPNYRVHVLDPLGRLLPTGVVGELCIAGAGLARGYLRRPAATAEKFVADPYGPPGSRLYRTGDLARWRGDGQIEFLGRNDQQVKIRGHRIETGEIEAVLLQHPAVAQAAVTARKDASGHNRLLAYLVARGESPPAPAELTDALAAQLPEHMVPSAIVWLPALPLTTNGKLDLRALPDVPAAGLGGAQFEAPQGDAETLMAALWCELLKCPSVGREDEFFALGGHSLVAIALAERLRQAGWQIDVASLFERPILRDMAASCTPIAEAAAIPEVPPVGIPDGSPRITPGMLPMVALTQAQIDAITATVPGGAAQVQDIYPLAPLQQGILYHHQLQPVGDVYLTPIIAGFESRADMEGFLAALQQVMRRHDILRTAIAWEGLPEAVQVVWRTAHLPLVELQPPAAGSTALDHLRAAVDPRLHRIDLCRAPLLKAVALHDPAESRWLLALCLHHLTLDHTSNDIVLQEVGLIRMAEAQGQVAELPPAVPFRQMVWHTRHGQDEAQHRAYFQRVLADVTEPNAPFGLTEVRGDAEGIGQVHRELPADLAQAIRQQARAHGVSAAALLHLAWALVLASSSEQGPESVRDDVVFGTVLFGRMSAGPGADRALGMMINTLPLRLHLGQRGVAQALVDAHAALRELMRHEYAPLALAQRCSGVAAPLPLFTSLFNLRHDTLSSAPGHGSAALVWAEERTGYPLALAVNDDGVGFSLDLQVQSPVSADQVAQMVVLALAQIVQALDEAPARPCNMLDILSAADRQWLLASGAPQPVADPGTGLLHHRVRQQARLTPDEPAVIDGDRALSYAQLDALSDARARGIRAALAGCTQAEPVVALALPRSLDTVLNLLAILKAGAVYLPLDLAYPLQRLQYQLDDAGAALLIDHGQDATAALQAQRLVDDPTAGPTADPAAELAGEVALRDDLAASPDRLAYVIYTSGSTGLPKPVGVSHRAAVNLALARQVGHDPIGPGCRVLAGISVGFDVSIGQLLLPLLQGAAIVIAPALKTLQPEAFWALLAQHGVTHINSVPSFFDTVSEALEALPPAQQYRGLRRLMLGGEPLTGALARKLQQRLPGTQIVNMYGPTEACIDATAFVVPADGELPAALPIGRPLANYRAYVLDPHGRLVPPGVAGELCLAGPGLARGYLGRPEATAEKFVADPHGAPGERLYRTGDLARWQRSSDLEPGQIEFLGRKDQQIKIRGFRVETGEIEAVLLQQPGVDRAAVVARKDPAGQVRLVAYVVGAFDPEALKAALAQTLPEHMLPSAMLSLSALPLTPNGKLDLRALPEVDLGASLATEYVAPRDAVEALLQPVWQQLLGQPRIGMADDFFALGGHSLLAMRLVTACKQALLAEGHGGLALRLTLRELLTRATIGQLADALQRPTALPAPAPDQALPVPLVALRAAEYGGTRPPVFCVHPQSGTTWCYAELVRGLPADVPVYGLDALGLQPGQPIQDRIEDMAASYVQALRQVQAQGPYRLVGYSSGGVVVYEMARQLSQTGQAVSLLALLDSPLPDGKDLRTYTEADVLEDNRRLLGLTPEHAPRNAQQLEVTLQQFGLVPDGFGVEQTQRMIDTARGIVQAVRRYTPQASRLDLLQVHALRREDRAADWSAMVPGSAVQTHALDCDHLGLVGPDWARVVAGLISQALR